MPSKFDCERMLDELMKRITIAYEKAELHEYFGVPQLVEREFDKMREEIRDNRSPTNRKTTRKESY